LGEVSGNQPAEGSQILAVNEGAGNSTALHTASDPSEAADWNGMAECLKGDYQYVALRRQEVVRWANSPSMEKTLITKAKEEKMGQTNTMKTTITVQTRRPA
jgi:hypothetical protein